MPQEPNPAYTDPRYLSGQYGTPRNLNARVNLHDLYSTNPYGWFRWVFDQYNLPADAQVLELGCGTGALWAHNRARIPAGWQVTLSDFSAGMLQKAQESLPALENFSFRRVDATALPLPFESARFDAVIANHMLYHIADRPALLGEIRRVLKPGGGLYATTVGERHLGEIADLLVQVNPAMAGWGSVAGGFTLENGPAQVSPFFQPVEVRRYIDSLAVTELQPLLDYIHSGWAEMTAAEEQKLRGLIETEMARQSGVIHITKDSGLVTGRKPAA